MICVQIKPLPGTSLIDACLWACLEARRSRTLCLFRFNDTPTVAYPNDLPSTVERRWIATREKGGATCQP